MLAREVDMSIQQFNNEVENDQTCNCLPACSSLIYNAESSQADFNWPKVFEAFHVNFSEFPGYIFQITI